MNEEHHLVIKISWENLPARLRLRVALALCRSILDLINPEVCGSKTDVSLSSAAQQELEA